MIILYGHMICTLWSRNYTLWSHDYTLGVIGLHSVVT